MRHHLSFCEVVHAQALVISVAHAFLNARDIWDPELILFENAVT